MKTWCKCRRSYYSTNNFGSRNHAAMATSSTFLLLLLRLIRCRRGFCGGGLATHLLRLRCRRRRHRAASRKLRSLRSRERVVARVYEHADAASERIRPFAGDDAARAAANGGGAHNNSAPTEDAFIIAGRRRSRRRARCRSRRRRSSSSAASPRQRRRRSSSPALSRRRRDIGSA